MEIEIKKFNQLSLGKLYEILALRTQVFVVEQECAYQEVDGHDRGALHVIGMGNGELVAYGRVVAPGGTYKEPSIGRVLVKAGFRRKGLARQLMDVTLAEAKSRYPNQAIRLQAQTYLEGFYKSLGFETISEPYPDVGIWHVDMVFTHHN